MAIQFTDFSRAPLQESPFKNILEDVLKGYQISKEPAKMAEEQRQRLLANQLKQLEVEHKPKEYALSDQAKNLANSLQSMALKHKPREYELSDALKEAQIEKAKNGGVLKPTGDVANALLINQMESQYGADDPRVIAMKDAYEVNKRAKEVNTRSKQSYADSLAYRSLPTDEKKRAVALTTGMGLDPTEGEQMLAGGKTLKQIAEDKGVKLDSIIPVYPVGAENIKQTQRRGAFVNELAVLDDKVADSMGKYQNKFFGYSLDQIADAIANDDPETQGKVLAARALAPEISALRLKVAGGNIGIEAIRELTSKSLGNIKVLESTVSPEAYMAMQKYMNKWLSEATKEYDNTINDYGRLKMTQMNNQGSGRVFNLATGEFE